MNLNRQMILSQRPGRYPDDRTFRTIEAAIPEPADGEFLVRNVFLPLDPGMRPVLSDIAIGVDEFEPLPLGGLVGYMTVGQVVESRDPAFQPGDWVSDFLKWQDYAISTRRTAQKFTPGVLSPSLWLSIFGVPGLSAWTGLQCLAAPEPSQTVVVTSAAGTVGSLAGQIARNLGCRVVGIAGGAQKCRYLTDELGFDAAVDYHTTQDLQASVRLACPEGVDILFDNVGNAMIDALLPTLRRGGRIVICGQVAEYHLPPDQRPGIRHTNRFVTHRLSMRGLFVYDHAARFAEALAQLRVWHDQGRLKLRETILQGFDQLPAAFARLFTGEAMGRTLVRIDQDHLQELHE